MHSLVPVGQQIPFDAACPSGQQSEIEESPQFSPAPQQADPHATTPGAQQYPDVVHASPAPQHSPPQGVVALGQQESWLHSKMPDLQHSSPQMRLFAPQQ